MRRFLGPTQNMGASFGFLLSYATTAFLPWRMCKLMLGLLVALPAAFAILLCEETPHWLVKKGNMEEARLVGFCSLLINFLFPPINFLVGNPWLSTGVRNLTLKR